MSKINILLEIEKEEKQAFQKYEAACSSETECVAQSESIGKDLSGYGLEIVSDYTPIPMFSESSSDSISSELQAFASPEKNEDTISQSTVIACEIDKSNLEKLSSKDGVKVWTNSELQLYNKKQPDFVDLSYEENLHLFDLASSRGGVDCGPFRPAVAIDTIRQLLGVQRIWNDGFRGQNIVVGIVDEGVNGQVYPVIGGFPQSRWKRPGSSAITSHGSMVAADILVAAPSAKLYDYPFLGVPDSGGALRMFQSILDQRRMNGTPHITNNSYGFVGVPPRQFNQYHEIWNINHPIHRKVREVVFSGAPCFFAAGNCGAECPSGVCESSGIGPGRSIHASNSLKEVITVAAVNSRNERIGYSSQGFGMFERNKPDISAYSHFFGNFGPGRPAGGGTNSYDSGTSAATPVAAGVAALLMSAFPRLTPQQIKDILIRGTTDIGIPGWDTNTGFGVINAAASYSFLKGDLGRDGGKDC